MQIKFKKLCHHAVTPTRATKGSAAADLYSADEAMTLLPMERALVKTGIAIELPSADYVALVFARSGLAIKSGITLSNCVGVIDSDYRGEICVGVVNLSDKSYTIEQGERIAQITIMPIILFDMVQADELSQTDRGQGGFGSTGKK